MVRLKGRNGSKITGPRLFSENEEISSPPPC
jgi:hypothetical protein